MAYINGKKIFFETSLSKLYKDKLVRVVCPESAITPTELKEFPSGIGYRSNDFSPTGMTAYIDSKDQDEIFFAITEQTSARAGFVIDLGEVKYVELVQVHLTNVYYETTFFVDYSTDGITYDINNRRSYDIKDGSLDVYRFKVDAETRFIRFTQGEAWTRYRYVVKGIEVFGSLDTAKLELKDDAKTDYIDLNEWYERGKQDEYDALWDNFQVNGTRTNYKYAWAYGKSKVWNKENFKPKYDIKPKGSIVSMFEQSQSPELSDKASRFSMKELEEELGITFDFSQVTGARRAFRQSFFKELNVIDLSKCTKVQYAFYSETESFSIERIERLIFGVPFAHDYGQPFGLCKYLTHIGFEGTIDCNALDLSACPLDHESLLAFVNCLVDKTQDTSGTTWSATLGSDNLAKLTDEEIAIAEAKGWNLK